MTDPRPAGERRSPAPTRRAVLAGLAGMVLLPAIGCSSTGAGRRSSTASLSPRWPDLPPTDPSSRPRPRFDRPEPAPTTESAVFHRRSEWATNGVIPQRMDRMRPVSRITIHHDGMPPVDLRRPREVAERIDLIRRSHQQRGWGDIGYHYVIDPMGGVWEGRPLNWQGAHVANQNPGNLGILVLGNFQAQRPTAAQLSALDRFVASRMATYRVDVSRVHTHQELAPTACPGQSLQAHMSRTRRPSGRLAMLATTSGLG